MARHPTQLSPNRQRREGTYHPAARRLSGREQSSGGTGADRPQTVRRTVAGPNSRLANRDPPSALASFAEFAPRSANYELSSYRT
jgi:hypothetical protein